MVCIGLASDHETFLSSCNFSQYLKPESSCASITQRGKIHVDPFALNQGYTVSSIDSSAQADRGRACNSNQGNIPIYWINLDRSTQRRVTMEEHWNMHQYEHYRVKGYTLDDIYIPGDVAYMWTTNHPVIKTSEIIPPRNKPKPNSKFINYSIILSGKAI